MTIQSKKLDSKNYTFLLHSCGLGGAELSTFELVQGLIEKGNTVECLLPLGGNILSEKLVNVGAKVYRLPSLTWWTSDPLLAIEEAKMVESIIESLNCDLVVTITGVIPQGAIAARNLGIPHVWCIHEFLDLDHGLKIPFSLNSFAGIVSDFSDKIVCNSKSVREYFFSHDDKKIEVIYPFPRFLEEDPIRAKNLFPSSANFRLGLIANFSPGKGHKLLLKATKEINKSDKKVDIVFFGAGGTDELLADLQSFIVENSMQENVKLRGYVESKKEIYDSIDVVIVPSVSEGFGRVPFEAMAYGKPIIYSDSGALSEYMIAGKTGTSFNSNDSESLELAIRNLIDSETEHQKFIDNGYLFVDEISQTESYVFKFDRICNEAITNYSGAPLRNPISKLIASHLKLTAQRDELTAQRDELTAQRDELTAQRDELTAQRDELTAQRDAIIDSRIWRLARPLRNSINFLKK
jgi:glycosyltransferase involved in cell wall biosynthesis